MKIFNVQNPQLFFINFVFSEKIIFKIISTIVFILSEIAPPYPISYVGKINVVLIQWMSQEFFVRNFGGLVTEEFYEGINWLLNEK